MTTHRFGEWVAELGQLGQPHILPVDDTGQHLEVNCTCNPEVQPDGTVVHHAFDNREAFESGARKPS